MHFNYAIHYLMATAGRRQGRRTWRMTSESRRLGPTCSFVQFADATIATAKELFDQGIPKVAKEAWRGAER
jgi:hypothetical protein